MKRTKTARFGVRGFTACGLFLVGSITAVGATRPTDEFAAMRPAHLNDAYQRASQAWDALSTPPVRSESAVSLLRECLHLLRGPTDAGYRFADLTPPERKTGQTGDLWVTLTTVRINHLYDSNLGEYRTSGKEAYWVHLALPTRRNPTRRNGEAFLESVSIAYRLGDSFKGTLTESPKKWFQAGEEYVMTLPYPVDAVEVTAKMATREADLDKTIVRIETRPSVVRDHEHADDFYLVVLAETAIDALKANQLPTGRAYARALYELLSARTGKPLHN
jgi:hypothetical protein